ncbi:ATP-binding protein [Sediminibacillus albus]|uniref:ATP-binding protein n=1 Tax=Sediminibacillus albus TaxID=407036 RepID=UPI003CCBB035
MENILWRSSSNRSIGGAGLGLTISQRIIRQHGGELIAENYPEGGAIMKGRLPLDTDYQCY